MTPGRCFTCRKNETAWARFSLPSCATTISNPNCRRIYRWAIRLYTVGAKSTEKSKPTETTRTRSILFGSSVAVTKLPSTSIASIAPVAFASSIKSRNLSQSRSRRSLLRNLPNRSATSSIVQSCRPSGSTPCSSNGGITIADLGHYSHCRPNHESVFRLTPLNHFPCFCCRSCKPLSKRWAWSMFLLAPSWDGSYCKALCHSAMAAGSFSSRNSCMP